MSIYHKPDSVLSTVIWPSQQLYKDSTIIILILQMLKTEA